MKRKRSNKKRAWEAARNLDTILTLVEWTLPPAKKAWPHILYAALWLVVQSTSYTTESRPSLQPQNVASSIFLGHHQAASMR